MILLFLSLPKTSSKNTEWVTIGDLRYGIDFQKKFETKKIMSFSKIKINELLYKNQLPAVFSE